MSIAFLIYLVALLPKLSAFFGGLAGVGGIVFGWYSFLWFLTRGDSNSFPWNKLANKLAVVCLVLGFITTALPSEKTAWLMLGGWAVQTAYESEDGQRFKKLILEKVEDAIKEKAEEIKVTK